MALKYFSSDHLLADMDDFLQSFRKVCKDHYAQISQKAEEIDCCLDECVNGVSTNFKLVQCSNYEKSIEKLHREIAGYNTHELELEVKSKEHKLCLLNKEIDDARKRNTELKKTSGALLETCCSLDAEKIAMTSKMKKKHISFLSVLNLFKYKLNCKVLFEKDNIYEFQFKDSKMDASIKILKEDDDSYKVIEVRPKLECQMDIINHVLDTEDYQGLISAFHCIFRC